MLQRRAINRSAVVVAVVLLLAGCSGAPSSAVVGRWGSTASAQPNLHIQSDGTFSGSDGCNTLTGKGTIEGDTISFGTIASTLKACSGVHTWLGKAVTGKANGDTLTVMNDGGSTIGTLKRSGS